MHDSSCADQNEPKATELIQKMVRGLRNLQIGDSTSVPSSLSTLEKQVKHAISTIGIVSLADTIESPEMHTPQGQGDVHKIMHDAVIETPIARACNRMEKESNDSSEATRISVSLLHRMIEELETKTVEASAEAEEKHDSVAKQGIAAWEETEEQFIRTIEGVDDPESNPVASRYESNELVRGESSSVVCSTPISKNISLEEVAIEEITPSPLPTRTDDYLSGSVSRRNKKKCCNESNSKSPKKKSILARMRKLLGAAFGRRKN
ncbi:uncharacterized protein LOC143373944 isoform X2 [Andrena cerasifolii]